MIDSKFKIIKPEECLPNILYSFSYNPESQPTVQRFYNISLKCFESWSQEIYEIFTSLRNCTIRTYMEISKAGRLHFHGYIKIQDIVNFYFYDLKKLKHYGTFEIDFINDPLKWDLYIKKQKPYMELFCKVNDMTYEFNCMDTAPKVQRVHPFVGLSAPVSPIRSHTRR